MSLTDFIAQIPGFASLSHADRIKHFAWFLHVQKHQETFRVVDVRGCYDSLHLDLPANLSRSVDSLNEKRPPELLKKAGGIYRLHTSVRERFDKRYGQAESTVTVENALSELR